MWVTKYNKKIENSGFALWVLYLFLFVLVGKPFLSVLTRKLLLRL